MQKMLLTKCNLCKANRDAGAAIYNCKLVPAEYHHLAAVGAQVGRLALRPEGLFQDRPAGRSVA